MIKKILSNSTILIIVGVLLYLGGKHLYMMPKQSSGELAPAFTAEIRSGETINLSDFKGKFVLLDFWGSWCGPCRAENPKLVDLYQKFKGKDFEILSVGIETKKDRWERAIKKDGLVWPYHFTDFKRFNSEAAKLYGVREIPTKFLIDKDGMIIGVNQSVAEIEAVLSKRLL